MGTMKNSWWFLFFLVGCVPDLPPYLGFDNPGLDNDGDGYSEDQNDCDDQDDGIHPGAEERCNGEDDDCDELVDEDPVDPTLWYYDGDGDGHGWAASEQATCEAPGPAYVTLDDDCDDARSDVHPDANEICDGGTDEDCDGLVDLADDSVAGDATWYRDRDGDGHGDATDFVVGCEAPAGYALLGDDCDDTSARIHPGHEEQCDSLDNDCDGLIDGDDDDVTGPVTWHPDADGDGHGEQSVGTESCDPISGHVQAPDNGEFDCDDTNASIHPGAPEVCNEIDEDCDGFVDEGATTTFYADTDGDGHGDVAQSIEACQAPSGHVALFDDCDDSDPTVSPDGTETCNEIDDNCDGLTDEGVTTTFYADGDGDGHGDVNQPADACTAPSGHVAASGDCDDGRNNVHPGVVETCLTTYDDNCDGSTNDAGAISCSTWYADADSDGYGDAADSACQCAASTAYAVADATDCDDTLAAVNPAQFEDCSTGVDDDCSGTDNDENAIGCSSFYYDYDGDGYGLTANQQCLCVAEGMYTALASGECDDANASVSPSAAEVCFDAVDNDCSGDADGSDAVDAPTWYLDGDADGFGSPSLTLNACAQPSGYVADSSDCDDGRDYIYPGAVETCLTVLDDDCDGGANDENATGCTFYYADGDGDGYGLSSDSACHCTSEGSYTSLVATDCNDADASISPAEQETCDTSVDEDCDGTADEADALNCTNYHYDYDGDGYGTTDSICTCSTQGLYTALSMGDCDETDPLVNVGYGNCGLMGDVTSAEAVAQTSGADCGGSANYCYGTFEVFVGDFDYDGDGTLDLLVSWPYYDTAYTDAGAAFLFLGPLSGTLDISGPGAADLFFSPTIAASVHAGSHLSTGDFDGDGATELMVSSQTWPRALWTIDDSLLGLGSLDQTSTGVTEYPYLTGESIGDVDADGADDAIFCENDWGGPSSPPCTVAYGGSGGLVASSLTLLVGGYPGSVGIQGTTTTSHGDLDGDGVEDFVRQVNDVYVHLGSTSGLGSTGDAVITGGNYEQTMVEVLEDVTGDGYQDLGVTWQGASLIDPFTGYIGYVGMAAILPGEAILPASTGIEATGTNIYGDSEDDKVGLDMAESDVDGDGAGDLLVSSNAEYPRIFYGSMAPGTYSIDEADTRILLLSTRSPVARAGDTNGDGYGDFLVGNIEDQNGGVFLFHGTYN